MHPCRAPHRPTFRASLAAGLLLAALPAMAQGIGEDSDTPMYTADSIDYDLGLTQMGIDLCESLEQAARDAGVAQHDILPRAECEAQLAPSLRTQFPREQCEAGGLHLARLEICLAAMKDVVTAKSEHSPRNDEIYLDEVDATLSEACEPSKICRSELLPL